MGRYLLYGGTRAASGVQLSYLINMLQHPSRRSRSSFGLPQYSVPAARCWPLLHQSATIAQLGKCCKSRAAHIRQLLHQAP